MALNPLTWIETLRQLDNIFTLEKKHAKILEAQAKELQEIRDRLTTLEAREEVVIATAQSAAGSAASAVVSQHIFDIARRMGALEERTRLIGRATPSTD